VVRTTTTDREIPVNEPASVPPIDLAIETPADPETAWQTVTVPERIALWFTEASPLGPVGSPYRLDFGDGSVVAGEVLAVEPGRRFAHSWAWEGAEPGEVTTVEWRVEPLPGGGSRVRLVHGGWAAAGGDATARDEHETYWTGYLDDLRDILGEA
jgi:uncharacterized protein YndB with AHSA1/START domain